MWTAILAAARLFDSGKNAIVSTYNYAAGAAAAAAGPEYYAAKSHAHKAAVVHRSPTAYVHTRGERNDLSCRRRLGTAGEKSPRSHTT